MPGRLRKIGIRSALTSRADPPMAPKTSGLMFDALVCDVITETEKLPDPPDVSVRLEGDTVQVALRGTPVHVIATVPLNPGAALTAIE